MSMMSIEESRAITAKLLAALTGEWQSARDVAKSVCCSLTMARDRLNLLAALGLCQRTDIRSRSHAYSTHVYRANDAGTASRSEG